MVNSYEMLLRYLEELERREKEEDEIEKPTVIWSVNNIKKIAGNNDKIVYLEKKGLGEDKIEKAIEEGKFIVIGEFIVNIIGKYIEYYEVCIMEKVGNIDKKVKVLEDRRFKICDWSKSFNNMNRGKLDLDQMVSMLKWIRDLDKIASLL